MNREEAIKVVRNNWPEGRHQIKEALETLIPELRKSESELMREFLIEVINKYSGTSASEKAKCIKWIKEHKDSTDILTEILTKVGLKPYKDGDQWCILKGENIQEGTCGFGDTIPEAFADFVSDIPYCRRSSAAWTKEDEKIVGEMCNEGDLKPSERDWLNKLRDRVWKKPDDISEGLEYAVEILTRTMGNVVGYLSDDGLLEHKKAIAAVKAVAENQPNPLEFNGGDDAHLHSIVTHLEQWIKSHPNTAGADIQGENVVWLKDRFEQLHPKAPWKPTKEQLFDLKCVSKLSPRLESLYNDINNL